jgi:hypothetical protein
MYVYIQIYIYIHIYISYVFLNIYIYINIYKYIYIFIYICIYKYIYWYISNAYLNVYKYIFVQVYMIWHLLHCGLSQSVVQANHIYDHSLVYISDAKLLTDQLMAQRLVYFADTVQKMTYI